MIAIVMTDFRAVSFDGVDGSLQEELVTLCQHPSPKDSIHSSISPSNSPRGSVTSISTFTTVAVRSPSTNHNELPSQGSHFSSSLNQDCLAPNVDDIQQVGTCSCSYHKIICKTCLKAKPSIAYSSYSPPYEENTTMKAHHLQDLPASNNILYNVGQATTGLVETPLITKKDVFTIGIIEAMEGIIEAMEFILNRTELSYVPGMELKFKNILKILQQMVPNSFADKGTQTFHHYSQTLSETKAKSSHEDQTNYCDDEMEACLETSNIAVQDFHGGLEDDVEFICAQCEDTIILYNNDMKLSIQRHSQNARHLLAMNGSEKVGFPCGAESLHQNSQSLKYQSVGNYGLQCESMDNLKKQPSKGGGVDFIQILPLKGDYQFLCTIFNLKMHGIQAIKSQLNKHKTKPINLNGSIGTTDQSDISIPIEVQGSHDKPAKNSIRSEVCQVCQKAFKSKTALSQHAKAVHSVQICKTRWRSGKKQMKGSALEDLDSRPLTQDVDVIVPTDTVDDSSSSPTTATNAAASTEKSLQKLAERKTVTGNLVGKKSDSSEPGKNLEEKWIKVLGKKPFSADFIFSTFSRIGAIDKMIVFRGKSEARILLKENGMACKITETWKNRHFDDQIVDMCTMKDIDGKKCQGTANKLDLNLPRDAENILLTEQTFLNTCSRVMKEAEYADDDFEKVDYLCDLLERLLEQKFPRCRSYEFGSRALGLANRNSDIDIFFDTGSSYFGEDAGIDQKSICNLVFEALTKSKECRKIVKVPSARVPIVKFVHHPTNLACDVSFRCGLGHRNTLLLKHFLEMNNWLRPLILAAKEWLRLSKIQAGKRGMTSYTLILMVIFYLQCLDPPLLPSVCYLQELTAVQFHIEDWNCSIPSEKTTFAQPVKRLCSTPNLLKGFFLFYGNFDFQNLVVCPLLGRPLKREQFRSPVDTDFKDLPSVLTDYFQSLIKKKASLFHIEKPVCVQDPFELSHNVAKGVPLELLLRFQAFCLASHKIMEKWNFPKNSSFCCPPSSLKSRVFSKQPE